MPIYDYGCSACGHVVEVIHGIHEAGPRFCPNCGKEGTMRKAIVSPAVHYRGSGWAKKDRSATSAPGKSRGSKADAGGSDAVSGGASAGQTGTEATPATTTKPAPKPSGEGD